MFNLKHFIYIVFLFLFSTTSFSASKVVVSDLSDLSDLRAGINQPKLSHVNTFDDDSVKEVSNEDVKKIPPPPPSSLRVKNLPQPSPSE